MDTTPKYILMSEKARKWLDKYYMGMPGDLYVRKDDGKVCMVDSNILTDGVLHPVFRQDQLQEMLYSKYRKDCSTPYRMMIVHFEQFTDDVYFACLFDSMEQFWLAFIMSEKYNKMWDAKNKEWIKCQVAQ